MPQLGLVAEQTHATKAYHRPGSGGKTLAAEQVLLYFRKKK